VTCRQYETQGRNGVIWYPGQETSLAPLCGYTALKKYLSAAIQRPHSGSAPGKLCPRYAPDETTCMLCDFRRGGAKWS